MEIIIAQITDAGSISADYYLEIVTTIVGVLILLLFNDLRSSVKKLTDMVNLHSQDIAVLKHTTKTKSKEDE